MLDAHDEAVTEALTWLEDEVIVVRRGSGGANSLHGDGLRSATFRHMTSRAGDPQLHTHCVTSAVVVGIDGRASALDGAPLYAASKVAGAVYQQALRAALTRSLGVAWQPTENAMADLAGVPDDLLKVFSRRAVAIAERADALGRPNTAKARQAAALGTRQAKTHVPEARLRVDWGDRLAEQQWSANALLHVARSEPVKVPHLADLERRLAGPEGVTANVAHYGRKDALLAWFDVAPATWTARDVVRSCDRWLAEQVLVREEAEGAGGWTAARFTCDEILEAEARLLQIARSRLTETGTTRCPPTAVDLVVADYTLTAEQEALVRELCTSGRGLLVALGPAGTGKSHALRAATEVLQESGYRVVATSTAAKTALELADDAGMDHGASLARLLGEIEKGRAKLTGDDGRGRWAPFVLDEQTVVVIDEGGMSETRHLVALAEATATAGAKLVIAGDFEQLQAVGAGGGLLDLSELGGVVELTTTVRAKEAWERDAQIRWRHGDGTTVLDYQANGRITLVDDPDEGRRRLLEAWSADMAQGHESLMLAFRRADVAALNEAARAHRIREGQLAAKFEVRAAECDDKLRPVRDFSLCAGDRVIVTRNTPGAMNGEQGSVRIAHEDGSVTVALPARRARNAVRLVRFDRQALGEGVVALGYALTGHKAQGVTVDRCHVLADGTMTKQWGYSTLTRGRHANTLTFVCDPDREATGPDQLAESWMRDGLEETAHRVIAAAGPSLGQSRARELALAR